ncbi:MAG: pyridoxamine 5'-phosphate oxidase family protein [Gammaproteobacteria bacterium]|nr:pyridoxamine 5'-phosphate oxidase family protein [Gammaproteobacteria bacterium]MDH3537007.1 pyridoxamine 5'-phosphate oxidase family protein [Gammaproteobacteria bacterium]
MTDLDDAREDFLKLRDTAPGVQLATLAEGQLPEASYAPCVWLEGSCYLYLSELSSHTANLMRNPGIGLMMIEDADETPNPFTRKRASLRGRASLVVRDDDLFERVMAEFHRRFGSVMKVIEPLPDFHMFRVEAATGSFVRGFGQAYELTGDRLEQLAHIDPTK